MSTVSHPSPLSSRRPHAHTSLSPDLHLWTEHHLSALPQLFAPISPDSDDFKSDPCVRAIRESTEEGKKVARNKGDKFVSLWRRLEDPVR
jgi:tRNA (guanine-N7-)-methyltransferase